VACVQPLVTTRTEVPAARAGRVSRVERWHRVALSAAKQSGRAVVPDVREPMRLVEAIATCPPPLIVLAEPSAAAARSQLPQAPPEASVLIGPEGGWAPEELSALAAAGASFLQVGGRTLRADAAPLVALTALLWEWKAM
jgi:16S rRNA (uracil1498-N3)-methyltransferase